MPGEPIAVAFVEVLPETAGFRAATEAQLRRQLAGTQFAVPASPQTTVATKQLGALAAAETEAASATTLLAEAQGRYDAALIAGEGVQGRAAKSHLQKAAAAEADAAAQRALFAITGETTAATVAEIDALVTATGSLNAKATAEERAAFATRKHGSASLLAGEAISAETATMAGLRGASLGVSPAFLGATVAAVAFFKSVEQASEFDEAMHLIESATGATEKQLKQARGTAVALGHDLDLPRTSAVEAAKAINFLTRSGFDLTESQIAARGALLLTAAAGGDLESSVREIDRLLDAFNLTAADSERVADAVAVGLRFTQGNAEEFASALASIGPAADTLGLSLEETNTLVLQLSESGLSAGQASGLLRQSFLRLASGSPAVSKGLAQIGQSAGGSAIGVGDLIDSMGHLRPDAFVRLADALQNVDRQQQLAILTQIFSRRSALAVIRIVDQQRAGYERMATAAREVGVAEREAEARTRSLGGQFDETKDSAADAGRQLGELATGPATLLLTNLNELARATDNLLFGFGAIGGAAAGLGRKFESAVPGGEHLVSTIGKIAFIQAFPTIGIARGVNALIGHFRHADEEIPSILDHLNSAVDSALGNLITIINKRAAEAGVGARSISTKIAIAQVTGNQDQELSLLREQEAKQLSIFNRLVAKPPSKEHDAAVERARDQLEQTRSQIETILGDQKTKEEAAAADAKSKAKDILQAAEERDQAFLSAINAEQTRREARVSATASTEALGDDIKASAALRNFLRRSIEEVRKRIREARQAGHETKGLTAELQALRLAKADVRREITRLQQESKQQQVETRIESLQLDVELATIGSTSGDDRSRGSISKEVSARQRLIRALKRAQDLTRKGTVEWKRLRNEIAAEQQAIRDLKKQRDKTQQDFGALSFAFLQEQQGVLANFGPNFFPQGALSVGGGTSTTASVAPRRPPTSTVPGVAPVRSQAERARQAGGTGITTGQGHELVHQVRLLVREVHLLRQGAGHPSNRHSEKWNKHVMDHQPT
jgi:TP901 family phage tail tape measure protein